MSTVTDQPGLQDIGASTGDLDDEDGGGLVNKSSVFVPLPVSLINEAKLYCILKNHLES